MLTVPAICEKLRPVFQRCPIDGLVDKSLICIFDPQYVVLTLTVQLLYIVVAV